MTDVNEKYEDLSRQFNLLFVGLVITSLTLTAYLCLQAKRSASELSNLRPRADEAIRMVQQEDANVTALFTKLQDFGRTHPDFQNKILSRYRVATNGPAAAVMQK